MEVILKQCDQVKLCQKHEKIAQKLVENFAKQLINTQILTNVLKILPKLRNFAKSGHTVILRSLL